MQVEQRDEQRVFDPWQQEVISISKGRHLVLAPPGCGKTDILTERVVHAHESGVDYDKMLCLTFTNRAAKGMAQRIADRTGNPLPPDLFVGNVHRYCSQMLFAEGVVPHNCAILDEGDVDNIVQEELCRRMNVKSGSTELMRFQHALWQLEMGMRGEVVLHGDLLNSGTISKFCSVMGLECTADNIAYLYTNIEVFFQRYEVVPRLQGAQIMRLARAYQEYKRSNDLIDYDDLLVLAYRYLKETSAACGHYDWIEIDEVQDLNSLQLALVDMFASEEATVVYLGDEQQAIFSFIGAKMETLEGLKQRCGQNVHRLHNNYRSPRYLLNLQNDFAAENLGVDRNALPTTDVAPQQAPSDLCLFNVVDARLEGYYAARLACRYGMIDDQGRVAILVSTNREADEVGVAMTAQGIPHFKISGTDLFSLPEMRLLLSHLCVLTDEFVFIAWARLLWGLKVFPSYTTARNFMREMRDNALSPTDFLLYDEGSYVQKMVQAYETEEIVIFDTETTGLDPDVDDIIQIAAITVRRGKIVGRAFEVLLETDKELPRTVGGVINPMIELYRKRKHEDRAVGLSRFMDYCRGKVLVGHNVEFDYRILMQNLRKSTPHLDLKSLCPQYFDTLKYIRLIRPRLRHYKLAQLIVALHLEGQNSHRADDDILATLSLLRFCHQNALMIVAKQSLFMDNNQQYIDHLRDRYREVYQHGLRGKDVQPTGGEIALVSELQYVYDRLLPAAKGAVAIKWRHLIHYLEADMVRADLYPTLRKQLERYTTALCTSKEADMCGGSLTERYIISTVHKAKGLEFETVVVYRAIDGMYPSHRSWTERQIQEDARRLFVALSRARRHLCILYDEYYEHSAHSLTPFLLKLRGHFTQYRRDADGKIREQ